MTHDDSGRRLEDTEPRELHPGPLAGALLEVIRLHAAPGGAAWLERAAADPGSPATRDEFASAFAIAARRIGKGAVPPSAEASARLAAAGVSWPLVGWAADELGRAVVLLRAASGLPAGGFAGFVDECYAQGDLRERQAVLRALALLPEPKRFAPLAIEACRSSIQPLFEAVACENPYPAWHFPDLNFNQLVLKALFTGVTLGRIVGLSRRITPELQRMAADYGSERRAAGRSVPSDIAWLVSTTPARKECVP
jgi:hypothetical protein